ncbi:MAG: sulfite exporter TauE/SafE family protein [Rhodospirillaceae bacterium]|nr:sulfite exporter TauE/SafE family protein [Rhodospirillales bacterium]
MDSVLASLSAGLSVCRVTVAENGGVLSSLFVTGVIGSLSHCTGMCGPFVLSQVAARLEQIPVSRMTEWHRLSGAALLPYHLGRATTYAGLGALGALAAGALADWGGFRFLAAALLSLAALFLLGMAVPRLKAALSGAESGPSWWSGTVGAWAKPLFASPTGFKGWALGVALGFIPCGLLYAALAAAAATGDPLAGAFAMLAFTAGTAPALVAVGAIGHFAISRWRAPLVRWAPLLLVANAGMLGFMAWQLAA